MTTKEDVERVTARAREMGAQAAEEWRAEGARDRPPLVISDNARAIIIGLQLVASEIALLRRTIEESR